MKKVGMIFGTVALFLSCTSYAGTSCFSSATASFLAKKLASNQAMDLADSLLTEAQRIQLERQAKEKNISDAEFDSLVKQETELRYASDCVRAQELSGQVVE